MSDPTNPSITHAVTLKEHNFIVTTLNRNPLGADVMEVAALIQKLNNTAKAVVEVENAKLAEAAKKSQPDTAETAISKATKGKR